MNILDTHSSYFKLNERKKKIEIIVRNSCSEYDWLRLLTFEIFKSSPDVKVEGMDFNLIPELLFVTKNNDLRDWNKSEYIFSNRKYSFLVKIENCSYSNDGLSADFEVSLYDILMLKNLDEKVFFPFPVTKMPNGLIFINLPLPTLDEEYLSYLCD